MASLKIGSINARGLGLSWKKGHILNDLKSLGIDVVAISETRVANTRAFLPIFGDYEIYASPCHLGMADGTAVLVRKKA